MDFSEHLRTHATHAGPPTADSQSSTLPASAPRKQERSEEHTSELQSPCNLVCRLLLEKEQKIHLQPPLRSSGNALHPRHSPFNPVTAPSSAIADLTLAHTPPRSPPTVRPTDLRCAAPT